MYVVKVWESSNMEVYKQQEQLAIQEFELVRRINHPNIIKYDHIIKENYQSSKIKTIMILIEYI